MHRALFSLLTLAWLGVLAGPAPGSGDFPLRGLGRPRFVLDARALPRGADSVKVELTWEIPFQQLTFRKEEGRYRARYDVTVVFSQDDLQVFGEVWERRARARTFAATRGTEFSTGRKAVVVPSGRYEMRVTVTDRNSQSTSFAATDLRADFGPARIGLSDLRFVRYTGTGVVPNPSRDVPVGEQGHIARLILHPELADSGTFRVRWRFLDPAGRTELTQDSTVVLGTEPVPLAIPIPSDQLSPGEHELHVRLQGSDGGSDEQRKATFFIRLTPQWFENQRQDAWEVLEILGEKEELRELRAVSDEEWPARVRAFWKRHDPTPGTPVNEYRDSIEERMETAASLFREPFRRPGWRTDRGRVLVEFGQPDRRTVRTGGFDGPASELWEYESPRSTFFFVDERGSGEYWLRR